MNMDSKRFPDIQSAARNATARVRAAVLGRNDADSVEIQTAFAPIEEVAIEPVSSIAALATTFQSGANIPDVLLVSVDPENGGDLKLLRDLRTLPRSES